MPLDWASDWQSLASSHGFSLLPGQTQEAGAGGPGGAGKFLRISSLLHLARLRPL